ncbi:MAG: hypothetical protein KGI64_09745 [Xanthomonadaceae bacterium]|nr:hypothetical protein [Xanthomonadaceae bacterium]
MYKSIVVAAAASLFVCAAAFAGDAIDDGHLLVKPAKNNTFATGEFIMGKAELFGYIGDLKDRKKITGIVLRDADRATPEQKHLLVVTAQAQKIDALVDEHDKLVPLVDPLAATPAAAK